MVDIEMFKGKSVNEHHVEIVERKGTGHPDQICDSVMEAISAALCREYLDRFGTILHHNIDKGLLVAGMVEKNFGGGRIISPMELIIGDRATLKVGEKEVPVGDIAVNAAKEWIRDHLRFVDPEQHVRYRIALAPGSDELTDIFDRAGEIRVANDTSAAVGFYPLSPTETAVLEMEHYLNGRGFKERFPQTGEDIKVMGARRGRDLDLTIAMPLLANYVTSEQEYFACKKSILAEISDIACKHSSFRHVQLHYNTLDVQGRGMGGVYLSLLGTSAEDADSGQVGRGNRVNGLISMNRPMGTEAAAGKNPVSHVGKIYSVLSHQLAKEIYQNVEGIKEVYVLLLSRIGEPVDRPQIATARLLLDKGRRINDIARKVEAVFERQFAEINEFCTALTRGEYPIC